MDLHHYMVMLRDFVVNWWPLLGLSFYCLLIYIFWRMLAADAAREARSGDRRSADGDRVGRHRRRRRGEGRAAGDRRVPARPEAVRAARRRGAEGRAALRAAGHRQDAAREGRRQRVRRELLLRRARRRSSRCSPASAPRASASSSTRRASTRPSIIFIDELDAVGRARTGSSFNREQDQTLNQLLVELDGFGTRRPGRRHGRVQPPAGSRPGAAAARAASTASCSSRRRISPGARRSSTCTRAGSRCPRTSQLDLIARQTSGLTGADLANIANEAAILAGRRSAKYVTGLDFDNALERVVAGLQQKKVLTDKERRILAYHEAGHALMSHLMGEVGHLQKVTIVVARQRARLHAPSAERGSLHGVEGRADRHAQDRARRTRCRAGRLRARHERRCERSREGDGDRARDGVRVGHVGRGHVAHAARGQLRALRGDEAPARQRAGAPHRRRLRGGGALDREASRLARPAEPGPAREGDAHARRGAAPARRTSSPSREHPRPSARPVSSRRSPARRKRPDSIASVQARGIHHVGVAVEDLDGALRPTSVCSARRLEHQATRRRSGRAAASLRIGEGTGRAARSRSATTRRSAGSSRSAGPGMHHVAYEVGDLGAALAELARAGAELIDEEPREGLFGLEVAFVHPDSVHGVLSEVVAVV